MTNRQEQSESEVEYQDLVFVVTLTVPESNGVGASDVKRAIYQGIDAEVIGTEDAILDERVNAPGNIPRKTSAQRANLRAKRAVRRHGDHVIATVRTARMIRHATNAGRAAA